MRIKSQIVFIFFILSFLACQEKMVHLMPKADPDNGGLFLPDGFGALVVAEGVGRARHLAVRDNGDIYVKLKLTEPNQGNIALRDTDGDGRADVFKHFGDYPNVGGFTTEMRIHKGHLYFSSEQVVYRQKLSRNKLVPEGKPEVIVIDRFPVRWHNSKCLAFDGEGGMYVTFSAPTNACEDWNSVTGNTYANVKGFSPCQELIDFAGIWRFSEDKLRQTQAMGQRFATGVRSVVGISWNNNDNSLYALNHGRDYLHSHAPQHYSLWENTVLPAEEFMRIEEGDDFGWPYTYYDHFKEKRMLAPEYGGDGQKESSEFAMPIMGLPAHWAPNDLLFYQGDQFPSRYQGGAFIAFHGSTNRAPYPQAGYCVAFVPFEGGKPTKEWEVFADGFAGVDKIIEMPEAKYRPVGLAEGPDGSLYVADSKIGRIWRIIYETDPQLFNPQQLLAMEKRKSRSYLRVPDEELDLVAPNSAGK